MGGGAVIYQANQVIKKNITPLSSTLSIFDAEIHAAVSAIETALTLPSIRYSNDLWIILDNQDVARQLLKIPVCSSQDKFIQFSHLAESWPGRSRLPHTLPGQVRIIWTPSHGGIQGNEQADHAAKEACKTTSTKTYPLTIASAKKWAKNTLDTAIMEYWQNNAPQTYKDLGINSFVRFPPELKLPRDLVAHIYAAR